MYRDKSSMGNRLGSAEGDVRGRGYEEEGS
jgi:hypothetical protein